MGGGGARYCGVKNVDTSGGAEAGAGGATLRERLPKVNEEMSGTSGGGLDGGGGALDELAGDGEALKLCGSTVPMVPSPIRGEPSADGGSGAAILLGEGFAGFGGGLLLGLDSDVDSGLRSASPLVSWVLDVLTVAVLLSSGKQLSHTRCFSDRCIWGITTLFLE